MRLTIDRFEGDYAVCEKEDGSMLDVKKIEIPASAKEGDVLEIVNGKLIINQEETECRRKRIEEKVDKLFGD
jgi:hypothetical protein